MGHPSHFLIPPVKEYPGQSQKRVEFGRPFSALNERLQLGLLFHA